MANNFELMTKTIPQIVKSAAQIKAQAVSLQAADITSKAKANLVSEVIKVDKSLQQIEQSLGVAESKFPVDSILLNKEKLSLKDIFVYWFDVLFCKRIDSVFWSLVSSEDSTELNLSHKLANEIGQWFLTEQDLNPTNKRRMELAFVSKIATSAPELAWQLIVTALDSMPPHEQKSNFFHWPDTYIPHAHPQTEFKRCPICGGEGTCFHAGVAGLVGHFSAPFHPGKLWMKCKDCGNLYTRFYPTELLKLGDVSKVIEPDQSRYIEKRISSLELHEWCDILNKIRSFNQGKSLLEVGVGQGLLIAVALELGYEVTAVEIVEKICREIADMLRFSIINCDFLKLEENKKFDIITMGDVIEHLVDPVAGLHKAYNLLNDKGVLWLSTPNFESSFSRFAKNSDPMWYEPYHITYFSRKGLMPLIEKAGFKLLEYSVSERYNGSMELILQKVSQP